MNKVLLLSLLLSFETVTGRAQKESSFYPLKESEYADKVHAVWLGQITGTLLAWPYEHHVASVEWLDQYPKKWTHAPVDDDWYYEMIAIDAFEKYGPTLTVDQLGKQWQQVNAGTWGSSEQARLLMAKGIPAREAGHPKYNKLWYSIGPQFSADIYGALAPGMPNLAGKIARELCHINGYAEGADGGVFVAGMISLAFVKTDPKLVVKQAAALIHPSSPYRQCIDQVISLAEKGVPFAEVVNIIEDKWHFEYPATNNAVANGGIVAASIWFGEGDFLKTVNLAAAAADFTDADCNAANAAAVIGAMHGTKSIPGHLVLALQDRITGDSMGDLKLTPVDERISDLSKRTVNVGKSIMKQNRVDVVNGVMKIPVAAVVTQPAELFSLGELMQYWNPGWQLNRAGFGGAGGGMRGIRGITYLDSNVLITYPRDEVRGLFLQKEIVVGDNNKILSFAAGSEAKKAWSLSVYAGNERVFMKRITGGDSTFTWENIRVDLSAFAGKKKIIRIYQRVLLPGREAGNAHWKDLILSER